MHAIRSHAVVFQNLMNNRLARRCKYSAMAEAMFTEVRQPSEAESGMEMQE
jgi:hypothetical protein